MAKMPRVGAEFTPIHKPASAGNCRVVWRVTSTAREVVRFEQVFNPGPNEWIDSRTSCSIGTFTNLVRVKKAA
jgi:hypothetical protein